MAETPAKKAPAKKTPAKKVAAKAAEVTGIQAVRRVAVIGGNRIPFARSNTVYTDASNQDMLTAAVDGLVERFDLEGERVGELAAGAVLKHSRDFNLARETVLGSKLSPDTPAFDVQQACDTGIQAAVLVANKIALGKIESGKMMADLQHILLIDHNTERLSQLLFHHRMYVFEPAGVMKPVNIFFHHS